MQWRAQRWRESFDETTRFGRNVLAQTIFGGERRVGVDWRWKRRTHWGVSRVRGDERGANPKREDHRDPGLKTGCPIVRDSGR